MVIVTKYLSETLYPITEGQRLMSDIYHEEIYIDGFLKKRILHGNSHKGKYWITRYFLSDGEDINAILNEFCDVNLRKRCVIYYNMQTDGNYTLWDWTEYSLEKIIIFKGKTVFDSNNRTFVNIYYDINTNTIKEAYKYFYENVYEGELSDILLEFEYFENGELEYISDIKNRFDYVKPINLTQFLADTKFSQVDFPWDQHTYYHNLYPLFPEGNTV
ncbi:hypothetical protein ABS768_00965 [Flavobacterium sp. ST-75]|uniref:Uncharacterized protein n=1 Tax=Flavobacterium rhizophilum TaxID=3163296 RepID=A0ABW8Y964_9FLAO